MKLAIVGCTGLVGNEVLNVLIELSVPITELILVASKKNIELSELTLDDFKKVNPKINKNVFKILSPESSIESRNSFGGTASREIKRQIRFWKRRLNG